MSMQTGKTVERFRREARAASALNHPNICTVHDIDEQDGRTFIAMEYLEGETIRDLSRREGALPAEQLVTISMQVAEVLQAAHATAKRLADEMDHAYPKDTMVQSYALPQFAP